MDVCALKEIYTFKERYVSSNIAEKNWQYIKMAIKLIIVILSSTG